MIDGAHDVAAIFAREFGGEASSLSSAPGRVNLIGEHTDYNRGFVLPMIINHRCHAAGDIGGRPGYCEVYSRETNELRTFRIGDDSTRRQGWVSYVAGVLAQLHLYSPVSVGVRIALASDVPLGAGLSSSAAVEVAVGRLACQLLRREVDPMRLAHLCRRAEHEFAGVPCGLMDQAVVSAGREDCAMLLDCRDESSTFVTLPKGFRLEVIDTGVKHALGDGAYRQRVEECGAAARAMGVCSLREATSGMLARITDATMRKRASHVISENFRVREAFTALVREDSEGLGRLMFESHDSLRDDYEVSCKESDRLVDLARSTPGVWGARMTGGGFGGCVIAIGTHEGLRLYRAQAVSIGAAPIATIGAACS